MFRKARFRPTGKIEERKSWAWRTACETADIGQLLLDMRDLATLLTCTYCCLVVLISGCIHGISSIGWPCNTNCVS